MAGQTKQNRMRMPVMAAFRTAFIDRDATKRADERDESGERVIAGRRAIGRGAISEVALQRSVSEDLETLMNTTNFESGFDLGDRDDVRRSILNYGLPDIVHRTIDDASLGDVVDEIRDALMSYEPRLEPETIRVSLDGRVGKEELKVRFVVRADLRCDPLNLPVEFIADVERDSGKIVISGR